MIIERITIKHWRGYRNPHTFQFTERINLLVGRNEAGKSTLFEALTRVLFDRHTSKAEEIRSIQPIASSLGPEATIEFKVNGTRYRARKRFLQNAISELYREHSSSWELIHEGDAADAQLRQILHGEAPNRTAARPEHRGLAQALWYLQSDGAIQKAAWNEGVREGLQGLVRLAARSPIERRVLQQLATCYQEYWTPTGRIASSSELSLVIRELPQLEERLKELSEKTRVLERYRADLEELRQSLAEKETELAKAQKELAESSQRLREVEALEREREAKERADKEAREKAERLRQEATELDQRQRKIQACRAKIKELEESLSEINVQIKTEAELRDRHGRRRKEQLEPAFKRVERELHALRALEQSRKLEKDRQRVEQHVRRIRQVEKQLDAARKQRRALQAPSDKDWRRFRALHQRLSVVEAEIEASAVRVAFQWDGPTRQVTPRPNARQLGNEEYIVAEPTEFHIEGVGSVYVRSGGAALKDLTAQRDELAHQVNQLLERFKAVDAEEMAERYEQGRELERIISTLEKNLEELKAAEPDAEKELEGIMRALEEEKLASRALSAKIRNLTVQGIRDRIASREQHRKRMLREIDTERKAEERATNQHLELVQQREATLSRLAELRAEARAHEESVAAILANYGTAEHLRTAVAASNEEARQSSAALEAFRADYMEKVTTPKRLYQQAENRVRELERQLGDLRSEIAATLARIEEAAAQGNYSRLADTEIELTWKRHRLEILNRRAHGVRLLHNLVLAYEQKRSAALSGPIQELVNRWLRLLSEDRYDALEIDHDLQPRHVRMAHYGADLPIASLSYGAQEQVVVLLRLAMAVLLSESERNLVVIDDRLVNADPVRMRRLCLILQEAAKSCQIAIATCNDTPYAGLGANVIRVPQDGHADAAT